MTVWSPAGSAGVENWMECASPWQSGLQQSELRELARAYAGDEVDDVPLKAITRASGGLPGPAHEVLGGWAEHEAARRYAAAAEWLSTERSRRQADLRFANNVIALKLARLYGPQGAAEAPGAMTCPYQGLASFAAQDAPFFFGREELVGELAARTVGAGCSRSWAHRAAERHRRSRPGSCPPSR